MAEGDAPLSIWNVGSVISSIAMSNEGTRVVCGSWDGGIYVWDVLTGGLVLGPLEGHGSLVWSVDFSPDGTRLVSGSSDGTIRLWDAHTGAIIWDSLGGHVEGVCSVVFSPDGTSIVSGSWDRTVRIWDALSGDPTGEPLEGHGDAVYSVAFSPDSALIASGSHDCSIRMWDVHTGAPVGEPLVGHSNSVYSVIFSPDSTRVVSGSADRTIRIWDVINGTLLGEPLEGYTSPVSSVTFAPDGTRIISGSDDNTVCIWDLESGSLSGRRLEGHTRPVVSVAISTDGTRIISGSWDTNICVWEMPPQAPSFNMVSSTMSVQQMFNYLVQHGCTDLSPSLDPTQTSLTAVASGGFGDIWRTLLNDGTLVVIKTLRLNILLEGDDKGTKRATREVHSWSKLHHDNVQELLGIIIFKGRLGMVSPWMGNGDLQRYLGAHPEVQRYPLCIQLGAGLSYLHSMDMVHGDLKAKNVLVSDSGNPEHPKKLDDGVLKINDFDYAILSDSTLQFSTTTRQGGGTFRWMAPELFEAEEETENNPPATRNKQTDVYALGMTMLEIITGKVPYSECRTDGGVCTAILKKQFPRRPQELSGSDGRVVNMWRLLEECWDYDPEARPDASSVLESLRITIVGST